MSTAPARRLARAALGREGPCSKSSRKSVLGLWDTVNTLTRLRPTKRDRYRVTIFGSARVDPDHWVYAAVRDTPPNSRASGATS